MVFKLNEHNIMWSAENCPSGNGHLSKINPILAGCSHSVQIQLVFLVLPVPERKEEFESASLVLPLVDV